MQRMQDQNSLFLLTSRVFSRWRPALLVFSVSLLLVAAIAFLLPSRYESHLKVVVKNERVDPVIGADKQTQSVLYVNEISEARINTEIQLLLSEDVLREVVANAQLAEIAELAKEPRSRRDALALQKLKKDLVVTAIRNSNVIEATYESKSPARAEDVLHQLSQAYMHSHRQVHGVPGSYEFFRQVSDTYSTELGAAENELSVFRAKHHIVTLPEQKSLALTNIARLEAQMQETTASAEKDGRSASELKRAMAALPENVERSRRAMPNQTLTERLNTTLIDLRNKRTQASFRYQPEDRVVRELDAQIAQTSEALAMSKEATAQEVSTGANPALDFARSEYVRASAEQAGDQAKARELSRQLSGDRASLAQLDGQSVEYQNLMRRVSDMEELDQTYRKRADDARLAEMLDEQRISNLSVIEEPFEPQLPSSPKRGLILALGFIWSLVLACGTALGLEFATERVHTPYALEQATGTPVLATVPPHAIAPSYGGAFPSLYLAMQRPTHVIEGRLS